MSIELEKTQVLAPAMPALAPLPQVNLMPAEISAEASFRKTQLMLGGATALVLAGLLGVVGYSYMSVTKAEDALAAEKAITTTLAGEEAKYAEVPKTLNEIDSIKNAQAQAMVADVDWSNQLDKVNQEFPQGLRFKSLAMTMTPATSGVNPLATPGAIGTITVEGVGPDYINVASWMDALAAHEGFVDPYYSKADLAYDDKAKVNTVGVSSTVSFTGDVYTHRFDRKAQ